MFNPKSRPVYTTTTGQTEHFFDPPAKLDPHDNDPHTTDDADPAIDAGLARPSEQRSHYENLGPNDPVDPMAIFSLWDFLRGCSESNPQREGQQ